MEMIKKREQVRNNQIIIQIPEDFGEGEVDVIIIPVRESKRRFDSFNAIRLNTKGFHFDRNELHKR